MVDGSCVANLIAYKMEQEYIPKLSIYSRYGLMDRMGDGFVDPPNRHSWTFEQLYNDWNSHGFLKTLSTKGYITVSYAGNPFIDFIPDSSKLNRHQVLALSCFLDSCYATSPGDVVQISAPHESGEGQFIAVFELLPSGGVKYTNANNVGVWFRFDSTRPSQI